MLANINFNLPYFAGNQITSLASVTELATKTLELQRLLLLYYLLKLCYSSLYVYMCSGLTCTYLFPGVQIVICLQLSSLKATSAWVIFFCSHVMSTVSCNDKVWFMSYVCLAVIVITATSYFWWIWWLRRLSRVVCFFHIHTIKFRRIKMVSYH